MMPLPSHAGSTSPPSSLNESLSPSEQENTGKLASRSNLVPIKAFVHEVLRRSRTSGCVLQTALCYLEAIRSKVPDLVRLEKCGQGVKGEPDLSDRVIPATEAELDLERQADLTANPEPIPINNYTEDTIATVRISDNDCSVPLDETPNQRLPPGPPLPPLPPLPSPLLCPRRAFLASLILASKFTQDKCYSNRAWAKLSGLPPREIGRCERALGEALDWRLWVGKQPVVMPTVAAPPPANRPVMKTQSESSLLTTPAKQGSFLTPTDLPVQRSQMTNNRGLRRCATLPTDAYAPAAPVGVILGQNDATNQMSGTEHTSVQMDLGLSTSTYTRCVNYAEKTHQSPSPQTPGLVYSPSSTESSSGDRTIQMSSFLDDASMGPAFNNHLGATGSESWPWENPVMTPCFAKVQLPLTHHTIPTGKVNPVLEPCGQTPTIAAYGHPDLPYPVPSVGAGVGAYPWVIDSGIVMYGLRS
ncbi:hypothetical protein H0H81_009178 [Sphagnurus paluster]|uniref:Uncharacterized protein n=1 Tax=Sphagnurus paluster TaxID=117069 RepID=A0A9P7G123_9AGAR|nr:hypothetical protein H0H81_009178 [Sphagnurus paluster]